MHINLHHLITDGAAEHPDRVALATRDEALTYRELAARTVAVGRLLRDLIDGPGDRVGLYLDKRVDTVTTAFGASVAGGVIVPVNPILRPRQVRHILADCGARVLVTSRGRLDDLDEVLGDCPDLRHIVVVDASTSELADGDPVAGGATLVGWDAVPETVDPADVPDSGVIDVDMAAILYTSGSTGSPKGVVLTHRNMLAGAASVATYLRHTEHDVILAALPLSFDAGFSQLTTAFIAGAQVVLINYLLPGDVVKACQRHGVTALTCVPPLWNQIASAKWSEEAASGLRYFANTGGRMPRATLTRLRELFPQASPYLMYGLTEAFRSTYLDPSEVDRRPDSIGKAIPNAEVVVMRPDGTRCDPDEPGELVHRGALVALGYWNDPERTAERFRVVPGTDTSWRAPEMAVWSGDAVRMDDEGFLYFVGRNDEMIKTSGYRVSPTEIEEAAHDTGLVVEAVALGVEDEQIGQRIALVVTGRAPDLTPEAVIEEIRRSVPAYMVPHRVVIVDEIPRSPNGKLDRVSVAAEHGR